MDVSKCGLLLVVCGHILCAAYSEPYNLGFSSDELLSTDDDEMEDMKKRLTRINLRKGRNLMKKAFNEKCRIMFCGIRRDFNEGKGVLTSENDRIAEGLPEEKEDHKTRLRKRVDQAAIEDPNLRGTSNVEKQVFKKKVVCTQKKYPLRYNTIPSTLTDGSDGFVRKEDLLNLSIVKFDELVYHDDSVIVIDCKEGGFHSESNEYTKMQRVMNNFSFGDVELTAEFFQKNKDQHLDKPFFKKNFLDYLISIGDYTTIIREYPDLDPSYTKKAKELQQIVSSNAFEEIAKLEKDSPNSIEVIRAILRLSISNGDFKRAESYVNKVSRNFKGNKELMTLAGQYYFLTGAYAIGIKFFRDIGYSEAVNEFFGFFTQYDEIKKETSINYKLKYLRNFYNKLNIKVLSDSFSPSIYTHVKFEILKEYLELATANRKADTSSLGKTYYVKMKDEYSRYLYILSLIFDQNIDMAKKELNSKVFVKSDYERKIKYEIQQQEAQEEERRKRERRREYREDERAPQQQRTNKAGSDFLGYYKLLGLTPKATPKDVKKAYLKIIAKNKVNKMNEKQKKEWEQQHIKLNKALEILSNKKNKEMYDNGIDPENPQPQYDFGSGGGFHFQGFEEFGNPFAEFFGGGRRSFRGGRRTQFVFI